MVLDRGWSQLDVPTGWVQIVRGLRSAKVCDMATCEQSAHEATGGIREATRRSEAHRGGTTDEASPFSGSSGGGFFVEGGQVREGPRGVGRHGRSSLRGDAGRVEACQVCCSIATSQCSIGTVSVILQEGYKTDLRFGSREGVAELMEAEVRLVRLEAEVAALFPPTLIVPDLGAQVVSLRAQLQRTEEDRDAALAGAPAPGCVPWPGSRRASHSSDARVNSSRVDTLHGRQALGSSGCFELRRPRVNSGDHIQVGRRSIEVE